MSNQVTPCRRHTNATKAALKEENKIQRLKFCRSNLEPNTLFIEHHFKIMHNMVHIDEKYFLMSNVAERYYLLPLEIKLHPTTQNKRFIKKVMFLVVVARPRFNLVGNDIYDRKIRVFPFIFQDPSKRNSRNR